MEPGTALRGTLDTLPLDDVLALLEATHQSGVLEFLGGVPAVLVFHNGRVTIGLSESGPTLQQVFIGSGITSADGWWEASERARQSGSLAAEVIAAGADPEQVRMVLYDQTLGVVFELLLPSDDHFEFTPGATHPVGTAFTFERADLLADARERVDAWKTILEAIPSTEAVFRPVRHLAAGEVTVDAEDWNVLALLDSRRSVAALVTETGMSAFSVCAVLHELLAGGLIEAAP